jgi:2-isopropylmalate synthase
VLIETTDGLSAWTTVGVGQNIIEASWEALCDAYLYGLIHADDEVSAPQSSGSPVRLGA